MEVFGQRRRGSYTVEAAFVMPFVLGIVFTIWYTLFLLHDRAILQANLNNIVFMLAEEEIAEEEYSSYLERGLWLMELKELHVKDGKLMVRGRVRGLADLKISVLKFFLQGRQEISLSEYYAKTHPEAVLRFGAEVTGKGGVVGGN